MWVIEEQGSSGGPYDVAWYEMRWSPVKGRRARPGCLRWQYRMVEALDVLWRLMWSSPVGIFRLRNVETGELIATSRTGFKTWHGQGISEGFQELPPKIRR